MRLLVLRPQPGADETAARARDLGLEPIVAPLFTVRPLPWTAPDPADFDAVMLTSASAARQASEGLAPFKQLPCYAVGEATAAAARETGFEDVRIGPDDGTGLLLMMADDEVRAVFHPCGQDHLALALPDVEITRVPVYAAEAAERLPVPAEDSVALLHSPRAAALFAGIAGDKSRITIAAISPRTARAAGEGWREVAIAPRPRDAALLELAARLCQKAGR
ncbi:uroporphyrinogen-III synthase [Allosphingosinicella sp.]|uniref:uroporphyrinogen-III synthase n=1 Tax=Allosphingosinicella sp. TaxID=2823234 RepID=UPI00378430A0